jgi:predicted DNA-binding transcriptional regulator AlpA
MLTWAYMHRLLAAIDLISWIGNESKGDKMSKTMDLAGVGEVADLLGLSRQRIDQLAADSRSGFPEPVKVERRGLATRRLWRASEVVAWGRATGRVPVLSGPKCSIESERVHRTSRTTNEAPPQGRAR